MTSCTAQLVDLTPNPAIITVLVIDDHRSFAELLGGALNTVSGMRCVGIATTAEMGIRRAIELQPAVIVVDIEMPGRDGLWATRQLREAAPDSVVAVVTAYASPDWVAKAARAGASAFISKGGSLTSVIDILSRARVGPMLVAPDEPSSGPHPDRHAVSTAAPTLTRRELEVLTYLGRGMQNETIARVVGVTVHTCRGYMKSLHSKLGVSTQLEAVVKAQGLGLIRIAGDHRVGH
jgi:DNA-binding NarL/FixJ family response regulator